MNNNLEDGFDPETLSEIDELVHAMREHRANNNLPAPSESEVQDLTDYYLTIKEGAFVFDMIMDGIVIVDVTADGIDLIDTETGEILGSTEEIPSDVVSVSSPTIDKKKLN